MLSTERPKAAHVLDHMEMIEKHNNTNFVQISPSTETRLIAEGKHAADRHTRSIATCLHLSLLAYKRVELSLCSFNLRLLNPAKLKQPIQQLPKEVESRIVVTSNDNLRTETAESLPNWRTRGNCREDGAYEILDEATAVSTELFAEEATVYLLKRCKKTGPLQEVLLWDCPKARMIREHVRLPFLYNGQITTPLHLLQQTIHKSRELTECQIPIVSTPRVQFGEFVCKLKKHRHCDPSMTKTGPSLPKSRLPNED